MMRSTRLPIVATALMASMALATSASAGTPYTQYQLVIGATEYGNYWESGWQASEADACAAGLPAAQEDPSRIGLNTSGDYQFRNWSTHVTPNNCFFDLEYRPTSCAGAACWSPLERGGFGMEPRSNTGWYFVTTRAEKNHQCGANCNSIGDPINPASGATHAREPDLAGQAGALRFERFYNSTDSTSSALGTGWRGSFSRSLNRRNANVGYLAYQQGDADQSSLYNDPASACSNGFAEIKSRVSTWQAATATYSNGTCWLSVGSTSIGTLAVMYSSSNLPSALPAIVRIDAIRDDGQLVSFPIDGAAFAPPPGIALKLAASSSGFALTDTADNVERYDTNGRLLSITSRAGIVQTLGYDSSGRLTSVTDSFGHSLTLGYDTQGRLSTVTRP